MVQQKQQQQQQASTMMKRKSKGIPDRWLQYEAAAISPLAGTRFLPFKTPLRAQFFKGQERKQFRFGVDELIKHVAQLDRTLGLVVDLTGTDRYYDCQLWDGHQVWFDQVCTLELWTLALP